MLRIAGPVLQNDIGDLFQAALESDTRVLAYEAGRKHKIRVNTIRYFHSLALHV